MEYNSNKTYQGEIVFPEKRIVEIKFTKTYEPLENQFNSLKMLSDPYYSPSKIAERNIEHRILVDHGVQAHMDYRTIPFKR